MPRKSLDFLVLTKAEPVSENNPPVGYRVLLKDEIIKCDDVVYASNFEHFLYEDNGSFYDSTGQGYYPGNNYLTFRKIENMIDLNNLKFDEDTKTPFGFRKLATGDIIRDDDILYNVNAPGVKFSFEKDLGENSLTGRAYNEIFCFPTFRFLANENKAEIVMEGGTKPVPKKRKRKIRYYARNGWIGNPRVNYAFIYVLGDAGNLLCKDGSVMNPDTTDYSQNAMNRRIRGIGDYIEINLSRAIGFIKGFEARKKVCERLGINNTELFNVDENQLNILIEKIKSNRAFNADSAYTPKEDEVFVAEKLVEDKKVGEYDGKIFLNV